MEFLFVAGVLVVVVILFLWGTYNKLVMLAARIEEAWSGIEVQLKRRADLIPNLIETVKGYAKHEKGIFENVTKARSAMLGAHDVKEAQKAENMMTGALKSLFAVAENYPDLKANTNFQDLQRELADTEDKIAYARQFYNSNVLSYNTTVKMFPTNMIAGYFKFTSKEFFDADEKDKAHVQVSF
jgi:LemA protein